MYATKIHRPTDLASAASKFLESEEARYLGGGQSLIPIMKQRLASASDLISLAQVTDLKGVWLENDTVTIGGGTTHFEVATCEQVISQIPTLAALAGSIGDPAVRHRGTLGGSLANNDPAADYPSAVLALDAVIVTNLRRIRADDYFRGLFTTALERGEILLRVSFPIPRRAGYRKFKNPASRFAIAAVFVAQKRDDSVRVAVTGAGGNGVYRESAFEAALTKRFSSEAIADIDPDAASLIADIQASAKYRAHLVKVMAMRAVRDCVSGVGD